MTTITILGDSWGEAVSLYKAHIIEPWVDSPGSNWTGHTEFYLADRGYRIVNFSKGNTGNMYSLERLDSALDEGFKTDWVVWFHTEAIREFDFQTVKKKFYINELNETIYKKVYQYAEQVKSKSNANWILIGGEAQLYPSHIHYNLAEYIKEDWRSEIIGKTLPELYTTSKDWFFDNPYYGDDIDTRLDLVERHWVVCTAMGKANFPDGCHPGAYAHLELSNWISSIIEGNET
jgi:hypothetical protein